MRVSNYFKLTMTILIANTLMACGGGGDSASANNQDALAPSSQSTLTVRFNSASVTVNEGETAQVGFNVDYKGNKNLSYVVEVKGSRAVDASVNANQVLLTTDLIKNIRSGAEVVLTVSDNDVSTSVRFNVTVNNTSFWDTHDELLTAASALRQYAENDTGNYNLITFLTDVDYRLGVTQSNDFDDLLVSRTDAVIALNAELSQKAQSIVSELEAFTSDSATGKEADLVAISEQIASAGDDYAVAMSQSLSAIVSTDGNILPEINVTTLNNTNGTYSLFTGNPTMGSGENGAWTFSESYRFLESVVQSSVCYAL